MHHCEIEKEFYIPLEDNSGNRTKAYVKYGKWESTMTLYKTVVPSEFEGKDTGCLLLLTVVRNQ